VTTRTASSSVPRQPRKPKPAEAPSSTSVLPMQLHVGDCFTDERGECEVVDRPYSMAGGKSVHVKVKRVGEALTEDRTFPAYERVAVSREGA
jgi:hypothetical protein